MKYKFGLGFTFLDHLDQLNQLDQPYQDAQLQNIRESSSAKYDSTNCHRPYIDYYHRIKLFNLQENMASIVPPHSHPSTPWGRLKNVPLDRLEEIGLPSKGDSRYGQKFAVDSNRIYC